MTLKTNDIVIYNDDISRTPYLVHSVTFVGKKMHSASLGLTDYPEIEQDFETPIEDLVKLSGAELKAARKEINLLLA